MSEKRIIINSGITFSMLLFLTFLVLKLTNVITWSWLWVTAPLWFTYAVILAIIFLLILIFLLIFLFGKL
jgi:hypothetical protein